MRYAAEHTAVGAAATSAAAAARALEHPALSSGAGSAAVRTVAVAAGARRDWLIRHAVEHRATREKVDGLQMVASLVEGMELGSSMVAGDAASMRAHCELPTGSTMARHAPSVVVACA